MWDDLEMDVRELGPLRVRSIVKTSGTTPKNAAHGPLTVVLMHGYGAPGDDLVSLAGAVDAPNGTTFIFPEAPLVLSDPLMGGDARAWWPIDVGRYERAIRQGTIEQLIKDEPEGMSASSDAVGAMLDALDQETTSSSRRIVLGGFSQGAMLATDVALRTKRPLAGLAILSGTLLAASTWAVCLPDRKGLHVFQSHGTEDPLLPFAVAERLRHLLDDAGLEVSFTQFEGGHGIPPSVMRDLGQFLHQLP